MLPPPAKKLCKQAVHLICSVARPGLAACIRAFSFLHQVPGRIWGTKTSQRSSEAFLSFVSCMVCDSIHLLIYLASYFAMRLSTSTVRSMVCMKTMMMMISASPQCQCQMMAPLLYIAHPMLQAWMKIHSIHIFQSRLEPIARPERRYGQRVLGCKGWCMRTIISLLQIWGCLDCKMGHLILEALWMRCSVCNCYKSQVAMRQHGKTMTTGWRWATFAGARNWVYQRNII